MPGNQNPLDLAKPTETKVVRRGGPLETQCYRAKAYKIPQNYGCDSPFFGSILTKLIAETGWGKAFICVMILALPLLESRISLFRFPCEQCSLAAFVSAYCFAPQLSLRCNGHPQAPKGRTQSAKPLIVTPEHARGGQTESLTTI